jgi:hypothetical protein
MQTTKIHTSNGEFQNSPEENEKMKRSPVPGSSTLVGSFWKLLRAQEALAYFLPLQS